MSTSLHHFQVNLKGMIDLLSKHLYSTPGVFIREALQNGVDAITARKRLGHPFEEKITVEIFPSSHTLVVHDNGIGLTESVVHQFLSQIGNTSKKADQDLADDFIGQFGVGVLSCFVVSDEIVIISRSAAEKDALEWRGRPDGTYSINKVTKKVPVGTSLYLTAKEEYQEFFEWYRVNELLELYGRYLTVPIYLVEDDFERKINDSIPPWKMSKKEALDHSEEIFYTRSLDVIPLRSHIGEVEGVAYILPTPVNLKEKPKHRVYLKNILLSEHVNNLLPEWAFFLTTLVNTNSLRPTASRESLYENDMLYAVRDELGQHIKQYLMNLVHTDLDLFRRMVTIHYRSLKALAVDDSDLYQLFIPYLQFETSFGNRELGEFLEGDKTIYVTSTLDEFRQVNRVAKAQDILVVNGGYTHDFELIRKLPDIKENIEVLVLDPLTFSSKFQPLVGEEQEQSKPFLQLADHILEPFQCQTLVRWFEPADIPVLYTTSQEVNFLKMAEKTKEEVSEPFLEVVKMVTDELYETPYAQLCFNYNNPIVRKAMECTDQKLRQLCIETLYTQALLLGNYPMSREELQLLSQSFSSFMNLGLDQAGGSLR